MKIRFDPRVHRGYIVCKRLNIILYIYKEHTPVPMYGFICSCGNWTKLDPYYHEGILDGVKV